MKFLDLEGRERGIDITPFKRKRPKSIGATRLREELDQLFPMFDILEEFPCVGTRLKIDFFLPRLKIAFEFDGKQHEDFVPHFHGDRQGYARSQNNDADKDTWCEVNEITLFRISESELGKVGDRFKD